jgi:hypothetical protein
MSRDPAFHADPYAFVSGNPLVYTDPTGLLREPEPPVDHSKDTIRPPPPRTEMGFFNWLRDVGGMMEDMQRHPLTRVANALTPGGLDMGADTVRVAIEAPAHIASGVTGVGPNGDSTGERAIEIGQGILGVVAVVPPAGVAGRTAARAINTLRLTIKIERRMVRLGIPRQSIGIPAEGTPRGYNPNAQHPTVGGNLPGPPPQINIDQGILQPATTRYGTPWHAWNNASLPTRIDAVIAHEWVEAQAKLAGHSSHAAHNWAIVNADSTSLPITPQARALLQDMRRSFPPD